MSQNNSENRVIIHVDMDAFFAAIEQRDNPELRGKPVVVGADPQAGEGRGVVSTCSYEAREYGIHSAQPISEAYRRCPHAVFLRVRGEKYSEVSRQIREILHEFTPEVEPISIDEAFLDVTGTQHLFGGKVGTAREIQDRIQRRTDLTASLGVAPSKLVAKIASDLEKPQGMVIVEPGEVEEFLRPLPVSRLWGVGPKTESSLAELGVETIGDLADCDLETLHDRFGKHGRGLWRLAHGQDRRPVSPGETVKSVGHEHTFGKDTRDEELIAGTLMTLCEKVARRLRKKEFRGRTITTKLRLEDFSTYTRATTLERPLDSAPEIYRVSLTNLERIERQGQPVRLIGVSVSKLERPGERQTTLFGDEKERGSPKRRRLSSAIDSIKERFGDDALHQGTSLRGRGGRE
jgi:nucleotidyltransferase/DNA polymerase involved in DNA repair